MIGRREWVRRAALGGGMLVTGAIALAATDGDRGGDEGAPLFVHDEGAGDSRLVFLPGLGASSSYWQPRMAPLGAKHRLTFVDLLGFGRSPKPWTTYTVARHVEALHEVLAPRAPFTLVAHSIGARLAVAYAVAHPEHVTQLLLVAMPYFGGEQRAKAYLTEREPGGWVWANMVAFAVVCLLSRRLFGWAMPYMARGMPPEVVADLERMTWRSSTSSMWEIIYRHDLAADVQHLPETLPMHCLHGDGDTSAPLDRMLELRAMHPRCTVDTVSGGDHQLVIKVPALVRQWIERWTHD